jgi:hypothetical protein
MLADVIERINVLAKASQVAMNFTNMRNEVYDDFGDDGSDYDSDKDLDYDSDDKSSDGDDDDYDDFIEGVDIDNPPDPPDPPEANVNETQQNQNDDDGDDDYIAGGDDDRNENDNNAVEDDDDTEFVPETENDSDDTGDETVEDGNDEPPIISAQVRKLADHNGVIPPVMQSRTRQQAQETGESLVTGTNTENCDVKTQHRLKKDTKKQQTHKKELESQLLKRAIQENKKKISNKLKKEKGELNSRPRKRRQALYSHKSRPYMKMVRVPRTQIPTTLKTSVTN